MLDELDWKDRRFEILLPSLEGSSIVRAKRPARRLFSRACFSRYSGMLSVGQVEGAAQGAVVDVGENEGQRESLGVGDPGWSFCSLSHITR